jgi:hypothetical protein
MATFQLYFGVFQLHFEVNHQINLSKYQGMNTKIKGLEV